MPGARLRPQGRDMVEVSKFFEAISNIRVQ
jgi:hypothetical protein